MGVLKRLGRVRIGVGAPKPLTDDQVARLPPEQRDLLLERRHRRAELEAAHAAGGDHPDLDGRAVRGIAGEVAYGIRSAPPYGDPIRDPGEWERVAQAERRARVRARQPYVAGSRPRPIRFTRVMTRASTQWEQVASQLGASGLAGVPHLVYGAYRVPDRIAPGLRGDRDGPVEWEFVHAADGPLDPAPPAVPVVLEADRAWVVRRVGEPSVGDEEVAIGLIQSAGMGPERLLGISRSFRIRDPGNSKTSSPHAVVDGVGVFVPAGVEAMAVVGMARANPIAIPPAGLEGVHIAVVNWEDLARVVHPARRDRPRIPSHFAHLPATPQELIHAYIEVVGLDPIDTHGVQVTYDLPFSLLSRSTERAHHRTEHGGDRIACADGESRRRLAGGELVVIAYRDSPAYAEGRKRWDAYQREVLQTALHHGVRGPDPVPKPDGALMRGAERAFGLATFASGLGGGSGRFDQAYLPRYCWPPHP